MLVLTRKIGQTQTIIMGDTEITVTVLEVNGNQVRLGTEAPREIAIHRNEIYQKIKQKEEQVKKDLLN